MKGILCVFVLCLFVGAAQSGFAEPKAIEEGSSELYELQDRTLNDNYRRIFKLYADDPVFLKKLKASQRAWLKFRDAELEALFPHAGEAGADSADIERGRLIWMGRLAEERAMQLARWIQGAKEDDPARGSIKIAPVR
ncbi:MAG: DUF1311 domain-containing protein [Desulfovibrio sp.]|nr:DUF1311 domain-containing protein [Desulfovibrio sp.]